MDVKQYVIGYVEERTDVFACDVLLIEKNKPAWQAGKFNLPGGKVEMGETPHAAIIRELKEEADLDILPDDVSLLGTIEGDGFVVYVMRCIYDSEDNEIDSLTDEEVFWMPIYDALRNDKLIDNLRYIIPFCNSNLVGWTLTETDGSYQVQRMEVAGVQA